MDLVMLMLAAQNLGQLYNAQIFSADTRARLAEATDFRIFKWQDRFQE
jgi:hypothetical protein